MLFMENTGMKKSAVIVIVVLAAALGVGAYAFYSTRHAAAARGRAPSQTVSTVRTQIAQVEVLHDYINTNGDIEAVNSVDVYPDIGGKIVTDFPAGIPALNAARPVLKKFDGWKSDLRSCASYEKMPANAKTYVEFIESFTETPVGIVSVGADRNDTYLRIHPWAK